jgi:pyrimidine operon attenuation protein/uracil phosphoribosyltransferase
MYNDCILTAEQAELSIRRIAYQIYEDNINEKKIIISGVMLNGNQVAKSIAKVLRSISEIEVIDCQIQIDKKNPINKIQTSRDASVYENQSVVIVDDVLHTGSTLIYAVRHFLQVPLIQCKVAVLINRNHKKFPIKADYKGISLSTSMQERVEIVCKNNTFEGYLI